MKEVGMEVLAFVFGICTAILTAVLGVITHKSKKKIDLAMAETQKANDKIAEEVAKKEADYQRLLDEEKTRSYRQMIVDEIDPLVDEIHRIKSESFSKIKNVEKHIEDDEKEFEHRIDDLKQYHNTDKHEVNDKLADLDQKHQDNLSKILESYKFRFIQLCKVHLKEGYVTPEDWEQIVTFYDLYRGLGGNGQAAEYFERVKKLENRASDNISEE